MTTKTQCFPAQGHGPNSTTRIQDPAQRRQQKTRWFNQKKPLKPPACTLFCSALQGHQRPPVTNSGDPVLEGPKLSLVPPPPPRGRDMQPSHRTWLLSARFPRARTAPGAGCARTLGVGASLVPPTRRARWDRRAAPAQTSEPPARASPAAGPRAAARKPRNTLATCAAMLCFPQRRARARAHTHARTHTRTHARCLPLGVAGPLRVPSAPRGPHLA